MARGKFFTTKELDLIMKSDIPDKELSKMLGRSVTAIQTTRSRINKKMRESTERQKNG